VEIISKMACNGPVARYATETLIVRQDTLRNGHNLTGVWASIRPISDSLRYGRAPMMGWLVHVTFVDAVHPSASFSHRNKP